VLAGVAESRGKWLFRSSKDLQGEEWGEDDLKNLKYDGKTPRDFNLTGKKDRKKKRRRRSPGRRVKVTKGVSSRASFIKSSDSGNLPMSIGEEERRNQAIFLTNYVRQEVTELCSENGLGEPGDPTPGCTQQRRKL